MDSLISILEDKRSNELDQINYCKCLLDQAFKIASEIQERKVSKEEWLAAGDKIAVIILFGLMGSMGQISIVNLGDVSHQILKIEPQRTSSIVLYSFILIGSQPEEAINSISALIVQELSATFKSLLFTMRGWIYASKSNKSEAINDFDKAFELNNENLRSLYLLVKTKVSMVSSERRGDVDFATQTIIDAAKLLQLTANISPLLKGDSLTEVKFIIENSNAISTSVVVLSNLLYAEAFFRRGPRGIALNDLWQVMENILNHAKALKDSLPSENKNEVENINDAFEKLEAMADKLKVMVARKESEG